ncbi:ABC transporter ATP-binding protein [Xylocopilactobacillus apicola]|uniref:ABC transporter ATP-binding protein n=1 Tax=Xylocopilactobacillus apicola TaxID=2932184 RepID=A0AAU9DCI6_9LACO|nr:ATP-binding cassette domain-containing protein [Xylocopilactobacillus apicola]BDR59275.1 ABC transporter ATP-binding protein [Xylocopilactobacillus apicola]
MSNQTILSVKHLNKSFGAKQILFDLSFKVQSGHIVGLVGPNGAGKTTILKAILGLIKSSGEILIDGQLMSFNHSAPLKSVGALIEYPGIYPYLTGRQHLQLFAHNGDIQTTIDELALNDFIDQKAKKYSLGMKQKLGIALALINNPQLVILDEPLNGLDPQATRDLRELIITKAQAGTTFLVSSHLLSELQKLADDLIVIDHGRLIASAAMNEILASNRHYVVISTNNDSLAEQTLSQNNYPVVSSDPLKVMIDAAHPVEKLLTVLNEQRVTVKDLIHEDDDLEQSILTILEEKNA